MATVSDLQIEREDFKAKADKLEKWYKPVSPVSYYRDIFGDAADQPRPVSFEFEHTVRVYDDIETMLQACGAHSDAYTTLFTYFKPRPVMDLLYQCYALTLDLDHVSCVDLDKLNKAAWYGLRPSYIVNSGRGLHLVFVLDKPLDCFNKTKKALRKLQKALLERFNRPDIYTYKADPSGSSFFHSYRIPGTKTKIDTTATAYQVGNRWTISALASVVGMEWETLNPSPKPFTSTEKKGSISYLPTGRPGFYGWLLKQLPAVLAGGRENALFGLSVVAYKCRIPMETLEHDCEAMQETWNRRDMDQVTDRDIERAMNGYQNKYVRMGAERLAELTGIPMEKRKKNGRTRTEHIQRVHQTRRETTCEKVARYLQHHSDATNVEVADMIGMSRQTVAKYRRELEASQTDEQEASLASSDVVAVQKPKKKPEASQTPPQEAKTSAEINALFIQIVAEQDSEIRKRLIQFFPPGYREKVRSILLAENAG